MPAVTLGCGQPRLVVPLLEALLEQDRKRAQEAGELVHHVLSARMVRRGHVQLLLETGTKKKKEEKKKKRPSSASSCTTVVATDRTHLLGAELQGSVQGAIQAVELHQDELAQRVEPTTQHTQPHCLVSST